MVDKIKNKIDVAGNYFENIKIFANQNKGLFAIALIGLFAIALWQKNAISSFLGFDQHFAKNDQDFKILILPFKSFCDYNGKNYDAGYVIKERLNGFIAKDTLKTKVFYWQDFDTNNFDDEVAKNLQQYHNADLIIYGTYQTGACSAEGDQICLNYLTDEKWKLGKIASDINKEQYQKGGLDELKKGKIQENVENIALFLALVGQEKNIDHQKYIKKLIEHLELSNEYSRYTKAELYTDLADNLSADYQDKEAIKHYLTALKYAEEGYNYKYTFLRLGDYYNNIGHLQEAMKYYQSYQKAILSSQQENIEYIKKNQNPKIDREKTGRDISGTTIALEGSVERNMLKITIQLLKESKRSLGTFHKRIGDVEVKMGNLEKAMNHFTKCNLLMDSLCKEFPNNVEFKNLLAISYSKLGETHSSLGNLEKALEYYEIRNQLGKELYAAFPTNVGFKNGLAISYSKLGETQSALGNLEKALEYYEEYNRLEKELYAAYPTNVGFKNSLAISYEKLGNAQSALGNLEKALEYYEIRNQLGKELYAAFPTNVGFKNGLALSYQWLGWHLENKMNDKQKAKINYLESQKLLSELAKAFPAYIEFTKNLQWVESRLVALA